MFVRRGANSAGSLTRRTCLIIRCPPWPCREGAGSAGLLFKSWNAGGEGSAAILFDFDNNVLEAVFEVCRLLLVLSSFQKYSNGHCSVLRRGQRRHPVWL